MQRSRGELRGSVISGSTVFDLTRVNDRAYYVPRGYVLEDELYCWRVKADRETGRIFFVNCGGLGKSWTLPDVFASNCHPAIEDLHGCRRTFSSPLKPSSMARHVSSHAILKSHLPTGNGKDDINTYTAGDSHNNSTFSLSYGTPRRSNGSPPVSSSSVRETVADMYANDMKYLQTFDEAPPLNSPGIPAHREDLGASPRSNTGDALSSPMTTQLQRMVDDYAEEVSVLRRKLEEQERLCMEKDLALVMLEERMVNMRVRMLEALSTYRRDISYWAKGAGVDADEIDA